MNTLLQLKNTPKYYFGARNTNNLVNGLFITINSTKNIDYADAYELLPKIQSALYETIKKTPYSQYKRRTYAPDIETLDNLQIMGEIFSVYSVGENKDGNKVHIHSWNYGLQMYDMDYNEFCSKLKKNLKKLKGISSRNEFGVRLIPVNDPIDKAIRDDDGSSQPILDYINKREYNTLMNYFETKNNKNFLYFY